MGEIGQAEGRWAGITFIQDLSDSVQTLSQSDLALLRNVERRPAELPLPGEGSKAWETPPIDLTALKTSPVCEFGEVTEILDNLQRSQLNPKVPVFEQRLKSPQPAVSKFETVISMNGSASVLPPLVPPPLLTSRPLNAASAPFVPNIPLPTSVAPPNAVQHPQTIHINHLTANVNYHVPHTMRGGDHLSAAVSQVQEEITHKISNPCRAFVIFLKFSPNVAY